MEEHATKLNNTDILPTEGHQVTNITKYYEFDQYTLDPGAEDYYYSFDTDSCGDNSDIES